MPTTHVKAAWLGAVAGALDAAPAAVPFFFRDDDAGWGDARLVALLDLFAARALPVDLAVIPAELDAGLARELLARPGVGLHQHGFAHLNHEPEGRKCEFGPSRPMERQREDVAAGRERLAGLLGDRVDPVFTPPWNRCTEITGRCLAELGFRALSREARAEPLGIPGLAELPVSVDWFAHRKGVRLTPWELGGRLVAAIGSGAPVGLMLHHAIMDAADMRRVADLLGLLAGHERVRAMGMMGLVG
jgi:peptidoglycan/xylan/chitin deacetylase (PgdA/CDA1 family)